MRSIFFGVLLVGGAFLSGQSAKSYDELIDSIHQQSLAELTENRLAVVYDRLAELHFYVDNLDSSQYYNQLVLDLGLRLQSDTLLGLAYRGKAMLMMPLGKTTEGIPYADTAIQYFRQANYPRYLYITHRNLAYQHARQGDCVAAHANLRSADSLRKDLELSTYAQARFCNTYAATLENCRLYDLIPGIIMEMLPEVRQMSEPTLLAGYYNRLIIAYRNMAQLDSALVYVEAMGELLPQASPNTINTFYTNAANVYYDLGETQRARELFQLGLSQAQKHGTPYSVNVKRVNLGLIEQEAGNFSVAIPLLEASKGYFEEANEPDALLEIYPSLAQAYAGLGRYRPAYENTVLAKTLGDSLSKVYYDNSLAEKVALNETNRTRYELEMVRLEKAEQAAKNQAQMRLLLLVLGGLLLVGIGG
ncbi:MAG: hypothetical protein AAFZ52_11300, partial [Bacteroidota bacterium]